MCLLEEEDQYQDYLTEKGYCEVHVGIDLGPTLVLNP